MCEFLIDQFKNNLSDWALVIATFGLAWLTWCLYSETRKSRVQNITPQLSLLIYFDDHQVAYLKLINSGKNDAKNVNLVCTTDYVYDEFPRYYNYKSALSRKFDYISVNQSYDFLLGRYQSIKDIKLYFNISFFDIKNENESNYPVKIDLSEFEGTWQNLDDKNEKMCLQNISENIRDIKQIFENVSSNHGMFGFNVSILKKNQLRQELPIKNNEIK